MRSGIGAIMLFIGISVSAQFDIPTTLGEGMDETILRQKPEFFTMDWKQGTKLTEKPSPIFIEIDSIGRQQVSLLVDQATNPKLYTAHISTPVCADGECRLMHIRLYWNLLGKYAGFDHYSDQPLTKHDHDAFLEGDYKKLHRLLMDDHSLLKRKAINELVKKPQTKHIDGVDAVAGATIKEVKESVVEGALYSCYAAWHLVHGPIKKKIKKHTHLLVDDALSLDMLASDQSDYQMFAIEQLDRKRYSKNYLRIAEIFESGTPLVRTIIIKNLPDSFWKSEKLQKPFWQSFSKIDVNSRNLLLDHLENTPKSILEDLSTQMDVMTKNQLKEFLEHLGALRKISPKIQDNLRKFASNKNQVYGYLVEMFLNDLE